MSIRDEEEICQAAMTELRRQPNFDEVFFTRVLEDTSAGTVVQIVRHFCNSLEQARTDLSKIREERDNELVSRVCHKLKGSAELLGLFGFSAELKRQQTYIAACADMDSYRSQIQILSRTIGDLREFLRPLFGAQD